MLSYITLDLEWADKYALFKQFMQNLLKLLIIPFFIPTVRVRGGPSIWLYLAKLTKKSNFQNKIENFDRFLKRWRCAAGRC